MAAVVYSAALVVSVAANLEAMVEWVEAVEAAGGLVRQRSEYHRT